MNTLLWVLQVLLALHTGIGAFWKFSHSAAATMPSLAAIPNGAWLTMAIVELLCAAGLVLPLFNKALAVTAPVAALVIAAEMILFCGLHLASGDANHSPLIYWLVVAAVCAFIGWGRFALAPL